MAVNEMKSLDQLNSMTLEGVKLTKTSVDDMTVSSNINLEALGSAEVSLQEMQDSQMSEFNTDLGELRAED